ncbi:SagB family peptide dehydrogenase [Streptomyces sp. H27-H5]|uniref:SagB family peptide dehydrogenase n=1 Tax=Streptomyces sp. H27-H5 TaxID=2996460 RepID=UPI0022703FBB|nr:SagB family peptide dehydrogenase [Streptomyces sp. H27-H5]MCY0960887.1 SagB family peptide dehydrogenase [Streptomyces sp. H27-H5]
MGFAHDYADAIMHRGRVPMEPVDFVPDWADRPRDAKFYPGAETLPLPEPEPGPGEGVFTLPLLSGMLRDSYGLTGRRLGVQANTDLAALPHYTHANWSRGTASGGGLYPVGVYWVAGGGGPLTPGVYHYAPHQHGLRRLLTGEVGAEVGAALGGDLAGSGQYLVLSVKYWQNAFKYNNFSFHAVSMDVGTVLQTWRLWARERGLRIAPALWFDEERLARLLGVVPHEEGIFAVVPLEWEGAATALPPPSAARPAGSASGASAPPAPAPAVRHRDAERSRTVLTFETAGRIHAATLGHAGDRPAPGALDAAAARPPVGGVPVPLPPAAPPVRDVTAALRARRSSFGRFDATRAVAADRLAAVLADCAAAAVGSEAQGPDGPRLTALYVFVNHVEGVEPGAYAYDPDGHVLRLVVPGPPGPFLQRNYFLSNYNLEQAGAVLVPTVRTAAVLDAVGDRGYRLVGATVGAVAQTFYTSAAAHDLGAGVALGFDNISYAEELGLTGTDEAALLIMLLGHERPRPADFRHEIA